MFKGGGWINLLSELYKAVVPNLRGEDTVPKSGWSVLQYKIVLVRSGIVYIDS